MHLHGMGTIFADLPRQGRNLRLYTYDPSGSQWNPNGAASPYNTGHYDAALPAGPCSQSDPKDFQNWQNMSDYAAARGEMLVLVDHADLTNLCSYRAPAQAQTPTPNSSFAPAPGGNESGGMTLVLNTAHPGVPVLGNTIVSPSAPLDTGKPVEVNVPAVDNTMIYAGLGLLALLVLRGRK